MLALVIVNHYKYVRQLRRRIAYIRQVMNGKIDLWPAKQRNIKHNFDNNFKLTRAKAMIHIKKPNSSKQFF